MAKQQQVRCEAEADDGDVDIQYDRLKNVTKKAALFVIDGDEQWLPFSQIVAHDEAAKQVTITAWIAREKGLD